MLGSYVSHPRSTFYFYNQRPRSLVFGKSTFHLSRRVSSWPASPTLHGRLLAQCHRLSPSLLLRLVPFASLSPAPVLVLVVGVRVRHQAEAFPQRAEAAARAKLAFRQKRAR